MEFDWTDVDTETDLDEVAALASLYGDVVIYTTLWLSPHWHDASFVLEDRQP